MSAQVKTLSEIIEETAREWRPKLNALETKANELEEKVNSLAERDDDLAGNRATKLIDEFSANIDALEKKLETAVSEIKSVRHQLADVISMIDRLPVVSLDEAKQIYEADKLPEFECQNCNFALEGSEQVCPSCKMPLTWTSENEEADTLRIARANSGIRCKNCKAPVLREDSRCPDCGGNQAEPVKQAR